MRDDVFHWFRRSIISVILLLHYWAFGEKYPTKVDSFFLFLFFFYDCGISFLHLVNSLMISDMAKMLFP